MIVSRIEQISGRSMVISYQQKPEFVTESSMYNPVLGSYVTAYARTTLLEKCLEVVGDRALYCDTGTLMSKKCISNRNINNFRQFGLSTNPW